MEEWIIRLRYTSPILNPSIDCFRHHWPPTLFLFIPFPHSPFNLAIGIKSDPEPLLNYRPLIPIPNHLLYLLEFFTGERDSFGHYLPLAAMHNPAANIPRLAPIKRPITNPIQKGDIYSSLFLIHNQIAIFIAHL